MSPLVFIWIFQLNWTVAEKIIHSPIDYIGSYVENQVNIQVFLVIFRLLGFIDLCFCNYHHISESTFILNLKTHPVSFNIVISFPNHSDYSFCLLFVLCIVFQDNVSLCNSSVFGYPGTHSVPHWPQIQSNLPLLPPEFWVKVLHPNAQLFWLFSFLCFAYEF